MFAAEFGTGQVFLSMLYFFLFCIWVWLLFAIFADIFRSSDLSGWGKAGWSIFVIVLPFIGVFTYLIARGKKMNEHAMDEVRMREEALRSVVRSEVSAASTDVDQLSALAALHNDGVIDDQEFQRMKAKITV
jgi:hypothetical protein